MIHKVLQITLRINSPLKMDFKLDMGAGKIEFGS